MEEDNVSSPVVMTGDEGEPMEERTGTPVLLNLSALEEFWRSALESNGLGDLVKGLVSQAFADQQQREFPQIAAALRSLQVSLTSVFLETLRAHTRPEELHQGEDLAGRQLWERIQLLFPDMREQRVAFLLFHCHLSPSDILRYAPHEFKDVQEINHLRRHILEQTVQHLDLMY